MCNDALSWAIQTKSAPQNHKHGQSVFPKSISIIERCKMVENNLNGSPTLIYTYRKLLFVANTSMFIASERKFLESRRCGSSASPGSSPGSSPSPSGLLRSTGELYNCTRQPAYSPDYLFKRLDAQRASRCTLISAKLFTSLQLQLQLPRQLTHRLPRATKCF